MLPVLLGRYGDILTRAFELDGNQKLNFSLFGAFSRHRVCNVKPQSSTRAFPDRGKEQNHAKKGNIRLPVAVRDSRTSVLKLPIIQTVRARQFSVSPARLAIL